MVLSAPPRPRLDLIPVLESGDHLTPAEFQRRYELRPDIRHAELIDGVVYVASPVRFTHHGTPHGYLIQQLAQHDLAHRGIVHGDNATVRFPDGSEVQPDGTFARRRSMAVAHASGTGTFTAPPNFAPK